jgi:RNA polymerase sigma-70 factor, ECF subfamily
VNQRISKTEYADSAPCAELSCSPRTTSLSILERIGIGETAAVRDCIEQYGALVWGLSRRYHRSSAAAADAAQEIFIEIWRFAYRYDPRLGAEGAFIATIARRRLIDRIRKESCEPLNALVSDDEGHSVEADIGNHSDSSIDSDKAVLALARLPAEQRHVLELSFWRGLSHSEIADRLGMPLGTVKSLLRRGLLKLRETLEEVETVKPSCRAIALKISRQSAPRHALDPSPFVPNILLATAFTQGS